MSAEELEAFEADLRMRLYQEYRDVSGMFRFVVETERGVYLANEVHHEVAIADGHPYVSIELRDAWVWDMYRQTRFSPSVRLVAFDDVSIEELPPTDFAPPDTSIAGPGSPVG